MADAPDAVFGLPLSPGERLVLVLLWRYASAGDSDPIVWPSAAKIAQITGFDERSVRRILAKIAKMGAISRCDRPSTAMIHGRAWRLHPDPSVTGPVGHRTDRPPDRSVRPPSGAQRSVHYYAASPMVADAIKRGLLQNPGSCSVCGGSNNVNAHHDDYLKPLDVRWLCSFCHSKWHSIHGPGANSYMTDESGPDGHEDQPVHGLRTDESMAVDPPVLSQGTERSPRIHIESPMESPDEAPPLPGFALQVVPAKRAKSKGAKRVKGTNGCSDEQWASVLDAYARARELGGMAAQWGAYRDNETNRGHAARIFRDGYSAADLMAVLEHIGRGLQDGTHEAKWTSLEHVARSMGRYLHEAAGPRQAPRERYADRGAVCYPPVDVDPPREVYEAEVEAAFRRAGQ